MPTSYDYAIIRIVPFVERGEFINAGVILFCRTQRFLAAQVWLDKPRVSALFPECDLSTVEHHLNIIPHICEGHGPIGALPLPERFHWLVAPRSTIIQTSPVHCGIGGNLTAILNHLMTVMVRI